MKDPGTFTMDSFAFQKNIPRKYIQVEKYGDLGLALLHNPLGGQLLDVKKAV